MEADKRARSAQERLAAGLESLSELFLLFDAEGRLVIGNRTWRELNRPIADHISPGVTLEDILRASIRAGLLPGAIGQEEEWLRARIERHRNPKGPFEIQRAEGP